MGERKDQTPQDPRRPLTVLRVRYHVAAGGAGLPYDGLSLFILLPAYRLLWCNLWPWLLTISGCNLALAAVQLRHGKCNGIQWNVAELRPWRGKLLLRGFARGVQGGLHVWQDAADNDDDFVTHCHSGLDHSATGLHEGWL